MKTFEALYTELRSKVAMRDESSGTYLAVESGVPAAGQLVLKRAENAAAAAAGDDDDHAAEEIAQLLYQVQVLMLARGLTLHDVYECL